jgi:hypothetical protein
VISLPYGSGANWCCNILASGAASIRWQGVQHPVVRAEVLGPAEALPLFPAAYCVLSPEFKVLYLAYIAIAAMSLYGCLYLLISTDAQAVAARFSAQTPVRVA